ncbi:hypothetical protein Lalb_Chr05g0222401 [Lupinus albus]|uniref:Uncharacterized protein n=1 Tax=Lupinus albus TaxID=3870 RepID=A0A6A4QIB8_LUPAL|nr:hypothetical protein Lalb_Chr05g0222401 [Lupinus albus]
MTYYHMNKRIFLKTKRNILIGSEHGLGHRLGRVIFIRANIYSLKKFALLYIEL